MSCLILKNNCIDLLNLEINGERIILKSINEKYSEVIFSEFTPEITKFMIPKSAEKLDDTIAFIKTSKENMKQSKELVFAILNKNSKEFLGCCGLHTYKKANTPVFGIWLKKSAHGYKYGQEAIIALAEWAKQNIDFDYFIYPVDKDNIPSRKIPESLGGTIIKEEKVQTMNGSYLNEIVYKIKI